MITLTLTEEIANIPVDKELKKELQKKLFDAVADNYDELKEAIGVDFDASQYAGDLFDNICGLRKGNSYYLKGIGMYFGILTGLGYSVTKDDFDFFKNFKALVAFAAIEKAQQGK